jgi:DNA modification methylase
LGRGQTKGGGQKDFDSWSPPQTIGWSDCGHNSWRTGVVLDPFCGSGTTMLVARKMGRQSIGIELSEDYAGLIAQRTQQLSLLA